MPTQAEPGGISKTRADGPSLFLALRAGVYLYISGRYIATVGQMEAFARWLRKPRCCRS
jgi:hypothetical protein